VRYACRQHRCASNRGEADGERERGRRQRHDDAGQSHGDRDRPRRQTGPPPVDPAAYERCGKDSGERPDRVGKGDLSSGEAKISGKRIEEQRDAVGLARQRHERSDSPGDQDYPAVVKRDRSHDGVPRVSSFRLPVRLHAEGCS
jgi:hypothetical protein